MSIHALPESAHAAVQALVSLDDAQFDELTKALEETPPVLDSDTFVEGAISRIATFGPDLARTILSELLTMVYSGSRNQMGSSELAADLSDAALGANSQKFPFSNEQRKILESRLSKVFTMRGLQVTGKAQYVFLDTDKRYLEARILTDLRPVFDDLGKKLQPQP
jgi:hypothetical protein